MAQGLLDDVDSKNNARCQRCGNVKPLDGFPACGGSRCKSCRAEMAREYYAANRDEIRIAQNRRYESNRDKVAIQQKKYRKSNAESIAKQQKNWRESNREKRLASDRAYVAANPEKRRKNARRNHLRKNFGISLSQYDEILAAQDGVCAICKNPCGTGWNLAVDHDHACCPDKSSCGHCVRGLLCSRCNMGIAAFSDDSELLARAMSYLQKFSNEGS